MKNSLITWLLASSLTALSAGPCLANTDAFIEKGDARSAPRGFIAMCARDATFCRSTRIATSNPAIASTSNIGSASTRSSSCGMAKPEMLGTKTPSSQNISVARKDQPIACASSTHVTSFNAKDYSTGAVKPEWRNFANGASVGTPANSENLRHRTSDQDMQLALSVNRNVNSKVRQLEDSVIYGVNEYWTRSTVSKFAQGDCEDIAIEKRLELIESGFDPKRLSFAVVYQRNVGLHTVLLVRLAQGDYVLDSRTPYINLWNKTAYSWVSVQDREDHQIWFAPAKSPQI